MSLKLKKEHLVNNKIIRLNFKMLNIKLITIIIMKTKPQLKLSMNYSKYKK